MNSSKIITSDKLEFLTSINNEKYYLFKPTVFKLFPKSGKMREMNFKSIIRFLWLLISGYRIYVITSDDDIVKGSLVLSRGGTFRYPFSTKEDLIDGPSYTIDEFRGQGVMVRLAEACLNQFETSYKVVYGTINKDNIASIRRCEKNGYKRVGYVSYNNLFHRGKMKSDGEMVLVAYSKGENKK